MRHCNQGCGDGVVRSRGFWWSRIFKNTRSRIFSSDSGSPVESFITTHF